VVFQSLNQMCKNRLMTEAASSVLAVNVPEIGQL